MEFFNIKRVAYFGDKKKNTGNESRGENESRNHVGIQYQKWESSQNLAAMVSKRRNLLDSWTARK